MAWAGAGRPLTDEPKRVEAIVRRQRNGAKRRAAPDELGPWRKAAQWHIRWSRAGVQRRALRCGAMPGSLTWARSFSMARACAPHQAACAKGGRSREALGRSRGGDGPKAYGTKACGTKACGPKA